MIAKVRFDGTFDIEYDDGEKEERVEKELIRAAKGEYGDRIHTMTHVAYQYTL